MSVTAIIIVLVALALLGIALLVISHMREKARIERMRRVKTLEDAHSQLRRFVDELPTSYLDKTLRRLILERCLELAGQLREIGAPGNVEARIEADQGALAALEAGNPGGPGDLPLNDQAQVKEIRSLLQMLFRFVERQKAAGRIQADTAREQMRHILFLTHKVYADLMVAQAREHYQAEKYRRAIHCYHLAASELEKSSDHPQAPELINAYRELIKELNNLANGKTKEKKQGESEEKAVPSSINKAWEEFSQEEVNWKKKPDYDD